jgi:hypothetical protein
MSESDNIINEAPLEESPKMGRPTEYTPEIGKEICVRISAGESVRSITRDKHLPCAATVYNWLLDKDKRDFLEQYTIARATQAEVMFEELLDIADDGTNDWMEKENKDGSSYTVLDHEHVQRSKLRVDTRKWYLSKVLPKKFGDKLDMTSDGEKIAVQFAPIFNKDADSPR